MKTYQASVAALDFVACQSKKRANTSNLSKYSIFLRFALFLTLIFINDPLIIINKRFAQKKLMFHTPRSAWAPTERKNVQLMEINV